MLIAISSKMIKLDDNIKKIKLKLLMEKIKPVKLKE